MTAETTPPSNATASSSKTSLYEGSTQYRHWRFSSEQLAQTRAALNGAAVSVIRNTFEADSARRPCFTMLFPR